MRVLCACEESQVVTTEFRRGGHEAYSCDLLPTSGMHPEWHIQADALEVVKMGWDMVLAFPPCTHLAVSGAAWFDEKRRDGRQDMAVGFFKAFTALDHVPRVAIENPVGVMSTIYRKPDQIIQPYMFGEPYTKKTCLWLKGLPPLVPTDILEQPEGGWVNMQLTDGKYTGYGKTWGGQREDGSYRRYGDPELKRIRSKTFRGIAVAMATQWGSGIGEAQTKIEFGGETCDQDC